MVRPDMPLRIEICAHKARGHFRWRFVIEQPIVSAACVARSEWQADDGTWYTEHGAAPEVYLPADASVLEDATYFALCGSNPHDAPVATFYMCNRPLKTVECTPRTDTGEDPLFSCYAQDMYSVYRLMCYEGCKSVALRIDPIHLIHQEDAIADCLAVQPMWLRFQTLHTTSVSDSMFSTACTRVVVTRTAPDLCRATVYKITVAHPTNGGSAEDYVDAALRLPTLGPTEASVDGLEDFIADAITPELEAARSVVVSLGIGHHKQSLHEILLDPPPPRHRVERGACREHAVLFLRNNSDLQAMYRVLVK